jgi:hypothetical protein
MAVLLNDIIAYLKDNQHQRAQDKLQKEQMRWQKELSNCRFKDIGCIKRRYAERIEQLTAASEKVKDLEEDAEIAAWKESIVIALNDKKVSLGRRTHGRERKRGPISERSASQAGQAPSVKTGVVNVALRIDKYGVVMTSLILSNTSDFTASEDEVRGRVRTVQFAPIPKQWKAQSIDVVVPVNFESSIEQPSLAPDASPGVSELLTLLQAAEKGDPESQYLIGKRYLEGAGVPRNEFEALLWLQKAADEGHSESEYLLGKMYEEGRGGVSRDAKQATIWFRKAAEQGNAEATAALARMQSR